MMDYTKIFSCSNCGAKDFTKAATVALPVVTESNSVNLGNSIVVEVTACNECGEIKIFKK